MPEMTDAELLNALEAMLKDGDCVEFWFDEETKVFWADAECGDTLREALERLVKDA